MHAGRAEGAASGGSRASVLLVTPYLAIDTWPGRRSGGMIVITSILGSLPFFLLLGFAGAIVLSLV